MPVTERNRVLYRRGDCFAIVAIVAECSQADAGDFGAAFKVFFWHFFRIDAFRASGKRLFILNHCHSKFSIVIFYLTPYSSRLPLSLSRRGDGGVRCVMCYLISSSNTTATLPHLPSSMSLYASATLSRVKRCVTRSSGWMFHRTMRSTSSSMSQMLVTQEP